MTEEGDKQSGRLPGFTLVELMVAIVIGFVAIAGFYKSFVAVAGVAGNQEQTVEMAQNIRLGLDHLVPRNGNGATDYGKLCGIDGARPLGDRRGGAGEGVGCAQAVRAVRREDDLVTQGARRGAGGRDAA